MKPTLELIDMLIAENPHGENIVIHRQYLNDVRDMVEEHNRQNWVSNQISDYLLINGKYKGLDVLVIDFDEAPWAWVS